MLLSHLPIANRLLAALPRADFLRLAAHLDLQDLKVGQILNDAAGTSLYVYFPSSALLSFVTLVDGCKEFAVALVGPEGMSNVACALGSQTSSFRTQVESTGQALRMKSALFVSEFRKCSALHDVVLKYVLSLTLQMAQTAACNRYHAIDRRLARWLLMTRDRLSSNHFYMTHEMLGQLMGVRRVGVTNAALALKERNLIDYSRGDIDITNGRGLQDAACSCYHLLEGRHGQR